MIEVVFCTESPSSKGQKYMVAARGTVDSPLEDHIGIGKELPFIITLDLSDSTAPLREGMEGIVSTTEEDREFFEFKVVADGVMRIIKRSHETGCESAGNKL